MLVERVQILLNSLGLLVLPDRSDAFPTIRFTVGFASRNRILVSLRTCRSRGFFSLFPLALLLARGLGARVFGVGR